MTDRRRTPNERRRAERAPFVAAVRERAGDGPNAWEELALARNLGETGMEIRRVRRSEAPTSIMLAFELPDGGAMVEVDAEVVWGRPEGRFETAGVRFGKLSAADRARIARYLCKREARAADPR